MSWLRVGDQIESDRIESNRESRIRCKWCRTVSAAIVMRLEFSGVELVAAGSLSGSLLLTVHMPLDKENAVSTAKTNHRKSQEHQQGYWAFNAAASRDRLQGVL
jgi:hypothetical protein